MYAFFESFDRKYSSRRQPLLLAGLGLLTFGILILLIPNLLEVLISSLFIAAGIFLLVFGWRVKRTFGRADTWKINF